MTRAQFSRFQLVLMTIIVAVFYGFLVAMMCEPL